MDEQTTGSTETPRQPGSTRRHVGLGRIRLGAVIAVVVAVGIIAWIVAGRDSSSTTTTGVVAVAPIEAVALSAPGLATLARTVGQPIYWAGPREGYLYELRRSADGNVYIRYLPPGVDVGASGAKYLTVATYPFRGAYDALKK